MTTRASLAVPMMVAVIGLLTCLPAGSAQAETGYRFWSYWIADDSMWTYAAVGSGTRVPRDGAVEGWRFEVAVDGQVSPPRVDPTFEQICRDTAPREGSVRVAIVLDPGLAEHAPLGQNPVPMRSACVVVPDGSTSYQALNEAASVRSEAGFVCGIDGYPLNECAPLITIGQTPQRETPASAPDADADSAPSGPQTSDTDRGTELTATSSVTAGESEQNLSGSPLVSIISVGAAALIIATVFVLRQRRPS